MDYAWTIITLCSIALVAAGILATLIIFSIYLFIDAEEKTKSYVWYARKSKTQNIVFILKTYGKATILSLLSPIVALPMTLHKQKKMKQRYRNYK